MGISTTPPSLHRTCWETATLDVWVTLVSGCRETVDLVLCSFALPDPLTQLHPSTPTPESRRLADRELTTCGVSAASAFLRSVCQLSSPVPLSSQMVLFTPVAFCGRLLRPLWSCVCVEDSTARHNNNWHGLDLFCRRSKNSGVNTHGAAFVAERYWRSKFSISWFRGNYDVFPPSPSISFPQIRKIHSDPVVFWHDAFFPCLVRSGWNGCFAPTPQNPGLHPRPGRGSHQRCFLQSLQSVERRHSAHFHPHHGRRGRYHDQLWPQW